LDGASALGVHNGPVAPIVTPARPANSASCEPGGQRLLPTHGH
jgi:hypothetical protein